EKNRPLYPRIQLFYTPNIVESVEPTLKEIGGNEILIATGAINLPMFFANIQNRKAVLEKKLADMADLEFTADIKSALDCFRRDIKKYAELKHLTFKQWQQFEGGFASLMLEPFAKEVLKYQFEKLSREKTRMVRGEPFMTFGLFIARSPQSSFENAVNKQIDNIIKETIYNELEQAWDDLKGWCHRKYPFGLFLDHEEPPRAVSKLWINEAIRNTEITKLDFEIKRGKRFEKFYSISPNSHAHEVAKKTSRKTLYTKIVTGSGKSTTLIREIHVKVEQLKDLLNSIADSTIDLLSENKQDGRITTVWKKLQETRDFQTLTEKEYSLLKNHTQRFFNEEFAFEPLVIDEIL
ncbi:MAG: hypothetical protein ACTSPI_16180, partial [Candidatus Heimdallarchaeaceae archaeon]